MMEITEKDFQRALTRLNEDGRLDCIVKGRTTNDGKPAPLCPEICSHHEQMCAGCAAARLLES